ncbi:FkbM family methyltransferase [Gymnodinialimonas hymeniacidonis]|uniref:FkbM family methyltransferase n=1 Tax=Gymnodinialimonas hymeniacidonis TaxID=3126508 RepID=UPI0034C674BF
MAKRRNPTHAEISPADRMAHLRDQKPVALGKFHIGCAFFDGRRVMFAVDNPNDEIQRHHLAGEFYEPEELDIIRKAFTPGTNFIDIGSNVGNHAVYVAMVLDAAKVVAFEPNPAAYEVLTANVVLNGLEDVVDLSWLGYGVSNQNSDGFGVEYWGGNLGGAKLVELDGGNISLRKADDMLGDVRADFVKIDVEGMELTVLEGLDATIARDRPTMFIEIDNVNRDGFLAWVENKSYRIVDTFQRYGSNENFLLAPSEKGEEKDA